MPNFTDVEMRAWRGFLHTHDTVFRALDSDLAEDGLNLPAYELLVTLQEAGPDGVRMADLARALRFSGGGLTRLADRLERQGLIERRRCPHDGRGFEARLTSSGSSKLKRVHVKHLRQVRARFLDRLSTAEAETLAAVWSKFPGTPVPLTGASGRASQAANGGTGDDGGGPADAGRVHPDVKAAAGAVDVARSGNTNTKRTVPSKERTT